MESMPRSLPVGPNFRLLRFAALAVLAAASFCLALIQNSDARTQSAQPRIVIAGWTLTAESCTMPDGLIEPGEPVTLSIALQNIGTANTSQQLVATLQASGGVTLETVRSVAQTGVDRIAVGAITHSAPAMDIGMDVEE